LKLKLYNFFSVKVFQSLLHFSRISAVTLKVGRKSAKPNVSRKFCQLSEILEKKFD